MKNTSLRPGKIWNIPDDHENAEKKALTAAFELKYYVTIHSVTRF